VCNDDATLTVTYEATFETDLHVATIPEPPADPDANIPQNRSGNPPPDEFACGDEHDCVGKATFEIPGEGRLVSDRQGVSSLHTLTSPAPMVRGAIRSA
jgi:hypothetical protein